MPPKNPFQWKSEYTKVLDDLPHDLKLDIFQFALDLIGIADPTGTVDATSGFISLARGDLFGAATSFVSAVPGGDIAKFLKLERYGKTFIKLVEFAQVDGRRIQALGGAMATLQPLLKALPMEAIERSSRAAAESLKLISAKVDKLIDLAKLNRLADIAPKLHAITLDLTHMAPDRIRFLLHNEGFAHPPGYVAKGFQPAGQKNVSLGASEIFVKSDGKTGYFTVRIDAAGNAAKQRLSNGQISIVTGGTHGGKPHVHKEWIPSSDLQKYLKEPTGSTMAYTTNGTQSVGVMGDARAKAIHHAR
jgi:hypothetical protein